MFKRIVAVWVSLIMLFSFVLILVDIAPIVEAPTTLHVGGAGAGNYSKIQWAIDNASDGDTVFVYNGTYYENILVNKTINLVGENKEGTIIDGGGFGDVVLVTADFCIMTSFCITNSGTNSYDAGIEVDHAIYCDLNNIIFTNNQIGLFLNESVINFVINSAIINNNWGLYLSAYSIKIQFIIIYSLTIRIMQMSLRTIPGIMAQWVITGIITQVQILTMMV